ncbi:hypothetical protein G7043_09850 [Lentzea sp. NEAU-D13]|uniref:Uncharacterized protein n=1 Tax=Lentzea alba TaxID=2714351 RepID=A0A7C9RP12_9PSEU|nr:hypothetical protein [Lentzea alba]NGY59224.1 hypothetical protein [Lentzea alba]
MAGRGGRNELSGKARFAAQVRTVHGGLHMSGATMTGVALVFAVVGLVLVSVVKRPEMVSVFGVPLAGANGDSAVVNTVEPGAAWDVIEVPKGDKPAVVAMVEAEEFLRREWPDDARLRDARSSRISGGLWFRADVVLPGEGCAGVVEVVVIDLGEVYSVLVITAAR